MARPRKKRRVCAVPNLEGFDPVGKNASQEEVVLTTDEYEAIRLIDYEKLSQEQCSVHMGVARTTITAIYDAARLKLADAIVNQKPFKVEGGDFHICEHKQECGREKYNGEACFWEHKKACCKKNNNL